MVSLYERFHSAYYWTLEEIDATSVDYLLTLLRVKMLEITEMDNGELTPIDEVL